MGLTIIDSFSDEGKFIECIDEIRDSKDIADKINCFKSELNNISTRGNELSKEIEDKIVKKLKIENIILCVIYARN